MTPSQPRRQSPALELPTILPVLLVLLVVGCGPSTLAPNAAADKQEFRPLTSADSPGGMVPNAQPVWYELASAEVKKNEKKTVGGGRYELSFPKNAMPYTVVVTISEWDSHVLDFQLGPHGIVFKGPVTLRINYSGTNADPGSNNYDGSVPELQYFNPVTGLWEEVPGFNDESQMKYYVELQHFSRYRLCSGKAGW